MNDKKTEELETQINDNNNYQMLKKKIETLDLKLLNIELKLDLILHTLQKNTDDCHKMSEHIDFVETVYNNVKNPLGYICNKVNSFVTGNYNLETTNELIEES